MSRTDPQHVIGVVEVCPCGGEGHIQRLHRLRKRTAVPTSTGCGTRTRSSRRIDFNGLAIDPMMTPRNGKSRPLPREKDSCGMAVRGHTPSAHNTLQRPVRGGRSATADGPGRGPGYGH